MLRQLWKPSLDRSLKIFFDIKRVFPLFWKDPFIVFEIFGETVNSSKLKSSYLESISLVFFVLLLSFCNSSAAYKLEPAGRMVLPEDVKAIENDISCLCYLSGTGITFIESETQRLVLLDENLKFIDETGGFGFGESSFQSASDILDAGFEIWICDPQSSSIKRFDRWLSPLPPFKEYLDNENRIAFERPLSASRFSNGDIAILEMDKSEILLLDSETRLIEKVASYGELSESLISPIKLKYSPNGNLVVTDPGSNKAMLFDRFGSANGVRNWSFDKNGPESICFYENTLWLSGKNGVIAYDESGEILNIWSKETFSGEVKNIIIFENHLIVAVNNQIQRFKIIKSAP